MTTRSSTATLLACTVIGVACRGEKPFEPERTLVFSTLEVRPSGANIVQGESTTVAATLTRSGGFTGLANVTVTGVPTGVDAVVSNVQSTGLVSTATVTIHVSGFALPGVYGLVVHGTGAGVREATAAFALTVEREPIMLCSSGGICGQWAKSATASSEYSETAWSANQATGHPDAVPCEDDARSWASVQSNGVEWLELAYDKSVRPAEIRIYEVLGVSSIVKVEVKDDAGTYHTVFTAQPRSQTCPRVLIIPVTSISAMVKVVRLSFDQRVLDDWNEIDAVQLIGHP